MNGKLLRGMYTIHVLNPALRRGCVDDKVPSRELGAHIIVMWLIHANF